MFSNDRMRRRRRIHVCLIIRNGQAIASVKRIRSIG